MVVGDDVELTHLVFTVFVVFDALDGAVVHCHVFQLAVGVVAFGFPNDSAVVGDFVRKAQYAMVVGLGGVARWVLSANLTPIRIVAMCVGVVQTIYGGGRLGEVTLGCVGVRFGESMASFLAQLADAVETVVVDPGAFAFWGGFGEASS